MREPPFDRPLALAAEVRTMRDHYLDVACGCGAHRVIGLGRMARDPRYATATLAHVALSLSCHDCTTGPDEVYLCATVHGRRPPEVQPNAVWTMPLVVRERGGSYHLRYHAAEAFRQQQRKEIGRA